MMIVGGNPVNHINPALPLALEDTASASSTGALVWGWSRKMCSLTVWVYVVCAEFWAYQLTKYICQGELPCRLVCRLATKVPVVTLLVMCGRGLVWTELVELFDYFFKGVLMTPEGLVGGRNS
jgi:hypothetical protein